jgi:hypothetical protein
VKSHPPVCAGIGDVSRDGVFDLGGSVSELVRDKLLPYDHPCWGGSGLLHDPVCTSDVTNDHVRRGGSFSAGTHIALSVLRASSAGEINLGAIDNGFRCRYPARAP